MITSPKGSQMISTISPIYQQAKIMQAIFQSIGVEWDDIEKISDDILLQLFPQTATWGLRYWEELLKIPVNETISIERRRAVVMAKIKLRAPMTPERISNVIKSLVKGQAEFVEVTENVEPHVFMVLIGAKKSGIDYLDIYRTIKRIKPSHESFYLGNSYLRSFSLKGRYIYGFSKVQHAIGTFICSKEDVEFIAVKGHRKTEEIPIDKDVIHGMSIPIVCDENLKFATDGFLNDENVNILVNKVTGNSEPIICSKDLVFSEVGYLYEDNFSESSDLVKGESEPLVCSKNLKFTRIEVVK